MPEGDTIHRTAAVLARALAGAEVVRAEARHGPRYGTPPDLSRVVGSTVMGVTARGKHLLIDFSVGLTLHSHLGIHGTWHTYPRGAAPARTRYAAARLETPRFLAACFSPTTLELVETAAVDRLPALASLGPDLLDAGFELDEARRRIREHGQMRLGEALLDQRALAGIGNVYRSELLFLGGIHPARRVGELDDAALDAVVARARELLRLHVHGGARVTTGADGARRGAPLWVYGRTGRPCRRCGTPIRSARGAAGGHRPPRTTYWCPRCQPESGTA